MLSVCLRRFVAPKSVDFIEQGRQGGEKLVVLGRRFNGLAHAIVFTQRHDIVGMADNSKCIAAGLTVVRRIFDTHDTFLFTRWPGRRFHDELSIESAANLRRKGNNDEARQIGHTSFDLHGGSN